MHVTLVPPVPDTTPSPRTVGGGSEGLGVRGCTGCHPEGSRVGASLPHMQVTARAAATPAAPVVVTAVVIVTVVILAPTEGFVQLAAMIVAVT